jgi:hypothetical protein
MQGKPKVLHCLYVEHYQREALVELAKTLPWGRTSEYTRWAINLMLEAIEKGRTLNELEPHTHHWKIESERLEAESFKNQINGLTGSAQEVK